MNVRLCYLKKEDPKGRWKSKHQLKKRQIFQDLVSVYIEYVCNGGEKKESVEQLLREKAKR